jgi:hypothetical protein
MNKNTIKLTESDLHRIIKESVKSVLAEGKNDFEPAKYNGKWSVYDKTSRTFSNIGIGKKKAANKANELNEAEDGGWVVEASEAQEAYNLAVQEMGEETINAAIVRSLGDETLAECLAYIFRQYDFREWSDRF